MELDDLKKIWETQASLFGRSLLIDERLLRETFERKLRSSMLVSQIARSFEVFFGIAMIVLTMSVISHHPFDGRYLIVGGGLFILLIYATGRCAYALIQAASIHYGMPVVELQKKIESIRIAEYQALKWTLLLGIVAWLPVILVLFEALTGLDALARVHAGWLAANLILGLCCAWVGNQLSLKFLERTDLSPWARSLMESLSGHSVRMATEHLDQLRRFEREE